MPKAIMDPIEVRRFAAELKRFNDDLHSQMVSLHSHFSALGDSWEDQEHEKFAEDFMETIRTMNKFVQSSNRHVPYLLRKAQKIEEYLNQK